MDEKPRGCVQPTTRIRHWNDLEKDGHRRQNLRRSVALANAVKERCCLRVATESPLHCGGPRSVGVATAAHRIEETNWNEKKQLEKVSGTPYIYFKRVIGQFCSESPEVSNTLLRTDQRKKIPNAGGIKRDSRHCRDRSRPCPSLLPPPRSLPFSSLATKAE
mmetsp:Transcript_10419/g.63654  ORF Transcript_10419/g.63654 Transcript_10419/m.63654 type:complete len:162 (-) Transcript_10419:1718-2203(-)